MRGGLLLLLIGAAAGAADADAAGHAWVAAAVARFNEDRVALRPQVVAQQLAEGAVDIDRFGAAVFQDFVERSLEDFVGHLAVEEMARYVAFSRERLNRALRERLAADLAAGLARGEVGQLAVANSTFDGDRGSVELESPSGRLWLVCHVARVGQEWRLEDLEVNDLRLSAWYRERHRDTFDRRQSPGVLEAQLLGRDYIVLEDLSESTVGQLPFGWRWMDRDEDRTKPYRVAAVGAARYLAARDSGDSVILLKFSHWDPLAYPIMTWCWRADALPPGADERFGHTNDSAAGIYVIFSQNWIGMPRQIKYVWSTTLPVGTTYRRNRLGRPYFIVAESSGEHLGEWIFESVDLEGDYRRTYGGRPRDRTQGLGLLTDANSTGAVAVASYADIRAWTRQALEAGRIRDYCDCYRQPQRSTDNHGPEPGAGDAGSSPGDRP